MLTYLYSFCHKEWRKDKDILNIEIPIERSDKCIKSEILIITKKEIKPVFKNMPHLEKIMTNYIPSTCNWEKDFPL